MKKPTALKFTELYGLNRLNLYAREPLSDKIEVYWVSATCDKNTEQLNFRKHRHTFYEIHFILRGQLGYTTPDGEITVKSGYYSVFAPNVLHAVKKRSDDFFKLTLALSSENKEIRKELSRVSLKTRKIPDAVLSRIDDLSHLSRNTGGYVEMVVKLMLSEIGYLLLGSIAPDSLSEPSCDDRVIKAKKFIEDNPDILFTTSEVASYCNLSTKQLTRLFRLYEKKSVLNYVHDQKLNIAKTMISTTKKPLSQIADSLGFSNESHFYKFFMKGAKMTPGEYRRISIKKQIL